MGTSHRGVVASSFGVDVGAIVERVLDGGQRDIGLVRDWVDDDPTPPAAGCRVLHAIPTRQSLWLPVSLPEALPAV